MTEDRWRLSLQSKQFCFIFFYILFRVCTDCESVSVLTSMTFLAITWWETNKWQALSQLNSPNLYHSQFHYRVRNRWCLFLSWVRLIHSKPSQPISSRSIKILSPCLRLLTLASLFDSGFPTKTMYAFVFSTPTWHVILNPYVARDSQPLRGTWFSTPTWHVLGASHFLDFIFLITFPEEFLAQAPYWRWPHDVNK